MSAVDARLDRQFERISRQVPAARGFLEWVRKPGWSIVRIPLALLLIVGGIFSFLPVLGLWMLPLGLLLFAQDVPFLQKPTAQLLGWIERKWTEREQRKRDANRAP